jgi:hypothetical protein
MSGSSELIAAYQSALPAILPGGEIRGGAIVIRCEIQMANGFCINPAAGFRRTLRRERGRQTQQLLAAPELYKAADVIIRSGRDQDDAVSSDRFDPAPFSHSHRTALESFVHPALSAIFLTS